MSDLNDEAAFDPETVSLLGNVLDRIWTALTPEQQTTTTRANIAEYILMLATHGERNATRLYESVLTYFENPQA